MKKNVGLSLCLLILGFAPSNISGEERSTPVEIQSVASILWQPSMNVFRRFSSDAKAMYDFYGKVLGLKQLSTFDLGGNTSVARFQAGASEFKLSGRVPNRLYQKGNLKEATGLRLLTFFYPDQSPLVERFRAGNLPAPDFRSVPGSNRRSALVQDPDGQWVELVVVPDASPQILDQIEIGLTVSDIEISRKFYREFVGLEELPPADDPVFQTKKYSFRHGTTIVSLRSFGQKLPADTGSGGIQYVVSDAKAVEVLAKARQVRIDQPLSTMASFALTTVWLDDPDGITNYFAETAVSGKKPAK